MSNNKNRAEMAWNDNNNQTPPELDEVLKILKINLTLHLVEGHQVTQVQARQQKGVLNIFLSLHLLFG